MSTWYSFTVNVPFLGRDLQYGYFNDDNVYYSTKRPKGTYAPYSPKGYGMGAGGMKGGKGMGGMKGGKGKGKGKGNQYPSVDDIPFFDDAFFDDAFFVNDECRQVSYSETFSIRGATLFLAPDSTPEAEGRPACPGTVFLWESSPVLDTQTQQPVVGTTFNGICTRTVGDCRENNAAPLIDTAGMCQFTFVDDRGYTINVAGFLEGPLGSQLAITGGTGSTVGIIGSMDFFPIYSADLLDPAANTTLGDVFLDTEVYEVIADIGIIVCAPTNRLP